MEWNMYIVVMREIYLKGYEFFIRNIQYELQFLIYVKDRIVFLLLSFRVVMVVFYRCYKLF